MMNNKIRSAQKLIDACPAAPQVDYYGNPITPTATPLPTLPPSICQITVLPYFGTTTPSSTLEPTPVVNANRYLHLTDADTPSTPPTDTSRPIPADTRYTLDVYALSATYPNVYQVNVVLNNTIATLWFNARSGVEVPAACANAPTVTPTPVITPTLTATYIDIYTPTPVSATATPVIPDTPLINSIQACENAPGRVRLPNSMTADVADCIAINKTIAGLQALEPSEKAIINRLLWLAVYGSESNKAEFKALIGQFFCVVLPDAESQWVYQRLNNVFLALLQTSYAFWKADSSLKGVQDAACKVFRGVLNFRIVTAPNGSTVAAELIGNSIILYVNDIISVQSAANIIHEIGHYFNAQLGGAIDNPGGLAPTSPLGRLAAEELKVDGKACLEIHIHKMVDGLAMETLVAGAMRNLLTCS
jgi:hypothetical protein